LSRTLRSSILGALAVFVSATPLAHSGSTPSSEPAAPPASSAARTVLFHGGTIRTNDGRGGRVEA
jgi:hypothetical protein